MTQETPIVWHSLKPGKTKTQMVVPPCWTNHFAPCRLRHPAIFALMPSRYSSLAVQQNERTWALLYYKMVVSHHVGQCNILPCFLSCFAQIISNLYTHMYIYIHIYIYIYIYYIKVWDRKLCIASIQFIFEIAYGVIKSTWMAFLKDFTYRTHISTWSM